ncbi:MAG: signal transduction protein with EFhand domain [Gallionellaceae bacterium]|nr:MAG: signal transduction protein with EFhand domain [Gallionellaceae bacterium]
MKVFATLIVAGGLLVVAPLAQACPAKFQGQHEGPCLQELDKNNDGSVSKKEFEAFHSAHFREMDANKDGKLTESEMDAGMGMEPRPMKKLGQDPFDRRFNEVDINHDGGLSKDEAEIGMPMLFKRYEEIDANKDGKMTKEEVIENMKKVHENAPAPHGMGMGRPEQK